MGGVPGLFNFLGILIYSGIAGILLFVGLFWGFSYWIQKKVSTYESSQSESHNRFVWLLVHILINIAKIDGVVSKEEISTIQRFFQQNLRYDQTRMYWVKDLIKEALDSTESMESLLAEFRQTFAYEPRLILLELIYQILYTKSTVPDAELAVARNIANYLQIKEYDKRTIEAKYKYGRQQQPGSATNQGSADHYYAVLGLQPGADKAAIKKAYRKLSMKYHPDKVGHLGAEFRAVAEEKMKEINSAYDFFKRA
jgi:DnaJ like chaperone protein